MPMMSRRRKTESSSNSGSGLNSRAGADAAPGVKLPFWDTHRGRAVLVGVSVILLTLAYAPLEQFYLAWVGLAPWLVMVGRGRQSAKGVFWWSWLAGIGFFAV